MKKFFTLLELLIVIAIIAILASLLMPSLSRAKSVARATQCTSNLKQIALGSISYYGDTGGYYPAYWTSWSSWSWSGPGHVLNDYLPDTTLYNSVILKNGVRSKYACPAVNVNPTVDTRTVGINTLSFGPANTPTNSGPGQSREANFKRWLNASKIKNPSAVCYFADANGVAMDSAAIVYRHQNSANVLYIDGHCGNARLYPSSTTYNTTYAYKIFWGTDTSLYP